MCSKRQQRVKGGEDRFHHLGENRNARGKGNTVSLSMPKPVSKLRHARSWQGHLAGPTLYFSKSHILIESHFLWGFVLISFHIYAVITNAEF